MHIYKTGRIYDFEQELEIYRVEGGYNFRDLSRCGIAGHIVADYGCTAGCILGAAILGHYDRGEYEQLSEDDFESSVDLDIEYPHTSFSPLIPA